MKIAFKNKRIIMNLIFGIAWNALGISYFIEGEYKKLSPYFIIALGLIYIFIAVYEYFSQYLTITDEKIRVNVFPKKQINISDVTGAGYYADDYVFRTPVTTLKVRKSQISPVDFPKFETFFNDLKSQLNNTDPILSYERK